jgi:hypothetical protein
MFPFRMAATCFVQPLDLVKNRMQLSGMYFHQTSLFMNRPESEP